MTGMRAGAHAVHHEKTNLVLFHGIAQPGSGGLVFRTPALEYGTHSVAPVMIAGNGIDGNVQRGKGFVQHSVGVLVPVVGKIAGNDHHVRLLNKPENVLCRGLKTFRGVHDTKRKPAVAAKMKI